MCRGFSYNAAGEPVPGDLIVAVGGERVQSSEDILAIIEQFNVGDMVPITVLRGRKQLVVNVTVKEMVDK
jgi:S1-C subfamily serine protease